MGASKGDRLESNCMGPLKAATSLHFPEVLLHKIVLVFQYTSVGGGTVAYEVWLVLCNVTLVL